MTFFILSALWAQASADADYPKSQDNQSVTTAYYSSAPVSHDSVTVSEQEQNQEPDTEAANWNSTTIYLLFTPVL